MLRFLSVNIKPKDSVMKKKIVLPSLFVLIPFLVGLTPKTSKAGSIKIPCSTRPDSVSYKLDFDSCYWLQQNGSQDFIDDFKDNSDSVNHKKDEKDSISYTISWQGGKWVKYTSEDGSGFIRTGGSRTWRNMNPGAIRHGSFSKQYGACGSAGGFAVFPTEEYGMNALRALLQSDTYANLTIAAAVRKYAPSSDNNNPRSYQQKLSRMTGLNLNKKLGQLTSDELDRVAFAIKEIEGWISGEKELFEARSTLISAAVNKTNSLKQRSLKQRQYNS